MANDKDAMVLTPIQRQMVYRSLETQIGVIKRRVNAEKSPEIKGILEKDVQNYVDLSRLFAL